MTNGKFPSNNTSVVRHCLYMRFRVDAIKRGPFFPLLNTKDLATAAECCCSTFVRSLNRIYLPKLLLNVVTSSPLAFAG